MSSGKFIIGNILFLILAEISLIAGRANWVNTFISLEFTTTNRTLTDSKAKLKVLRRGVYGFSGYHFLHKDIMDDGLRFEMKTFFNSRHNENFEPSPMHMPSSTPLYYLNTFYSRYLMGSVKDCSNAPQFEGNLTSYENLARNYTFENCLISADYFPQFIRAGYYVVLGIQTRIRPPYINATFRFNSKVETIVLRD